MREPLRINTGSVMSAVQELPKASLEANPVDAEMQQRHREIQQCIEDSEIATVNGFSVVTDIWNTQYNTVEGKMERKIFLTALSEKIREAAMLKDIVVAFVSGCSVTWEELEQYFPDGSVGMDGSVEGGVQLDSEHKKANWAHHGDDCQQDKCTCELIFQDFLNGTLNVFKAPDGKTKGVMIFNHFDQDGLLSCYLFSKLSSMTEKQIERMKHLVELEGIMDRAAGFADISNEDLQELNWVFKPVTTARRVFGWTLERATASDIKDVIVECFQRFDMYVNEKAGKEPLSLGYDTLAAMKGCEIVSQKGADARVQLTREVKAKEIDTYVVALPTLFMKPEAQEKDARHIYTIKFFDTSMKSWMEDRLNKVESLSDGECDQSLENQYALALRKEPVKAFGGHHDLLANHRVGSRRDAKAFGEMYFFLREQYKKETTPAASSSSARADQ